jgi:hypothetical protein
MSSPPAVALVPPVIASSSGGRSDLRDLARITRPDGTELLQRVLIAAQDILGMQLSYLSEWKDDELSIGRSSAPTPVPGGRHGGGA